MEHNEIVFPSRIKDERDLHILLSTIARAEEGRVIDLSRLSFYTPAAIAATLCCAERMKMRFDEQSKCFKYFQRMDFFKHARPEMRFDEAFVRRESANFLPILKIEGKGEKEEAEIARKIANTIHGANTSEECCHNFDETLRYAVCEVVRNVQQHSDSHGYILSQYYPKEDIVRIGIADSGIGILESFRRNGSPFYTEGVDDHLSMLKKAMERWGSSKTHLRTGAYQQGTANQGVGLTMLWSICKKNNGCFFLASGNAYAYCDGEKPPVFCRLDGEIVGTVCSVALSRFILAQQSFSEVRKDAFQAVEDTYNEGVDEFVERMFE